MHDIDVIYYNYIYLKHYIETNIQYNYYITTNYILLLFAIATLHILRL